MIVNKLLVRTIEAARAAPSQREPEAAVASAVGGTGSDVVGCLSGGGGGVGAIGCRRARRPRRSQSRRMKIRTWGLCNFRGQVSSYLSALACFFLYAAPPVVRRSTAPMLHTSGREPLKHTQPTFLFASPSHIHTTRLHTQSTLPPPPPLPFPISALRRSQSPSAAGPSLPSSAS